MPKKRINRMTLDEALQAATAAAASLNAYHAVVEMLEGGTIWSGADRRPAQRIIEIAKAATQAELRRLDDARAQVRLLAGTGGAHG